jgi:hypothetical protein
VIPQFDPVTGNLPPGVHGASWEELLVRFGCTSHRLRLLAGLKDALDALHLAGCRRVYIDGSFVTAKEEPGDFDACWEIDGVDISELDQLAPELLDFTARRAAQKLRFGGEMFPAETPAEPGGSVFLDYFQRDKRTGESKGIVVIDLGDLP